MMTPSQKAVFEILRVKHLKDKAVKAQRFQMAASLRDKEKKLLENKDIHLKEFSL